MKKRLQEYVKYTKAELDSYAKTPGSCVYKINTNLHFGLNPYVLSDLNTALPAYILKHRVGYYDAKLNGVLLGVKNIKVLNGVARLRAEDPQLHFDINADCYLFRPEEGAILAGISKHIGKHNVGVIIYRVFNASIRLDEEVDKSIFKLDQEVKFCVKNFNIRASHPYIQGTLLHIKTEKANQETKAKKIKFEIDNESEDEDHGNNYTPDSGVDEEEVNIDREQELSELLNLIKNEPLSESEILSDSPKQKINASKRKIKITDTSSSMNIKSEEGSANKKNRKSSESTENSESNMENVNTKKKKIKKEKVD